VVQGVSPVRVKLKVPGEVIAWGAVEFPSAAEVPHSNQT
jgi:hypothetical protein